MNTMNMPGFTAEASLYTTEERHRRASFPISVTVSGRVLPQTLVCLVDEAGVTTCFHTAPLYCPSLTCEVDRGSVVCYCG
jgi:hypothetical protein